jgi:uncharacterized protein (TIGR02270 family)
LLGILARRDLEPPPLIEWLQGDDVAVARAATEAARRADPRRHLPVIEWLLDHPDERVREAALVAAWTWGSHLAPAACKRWALDPATPHPLPMALYAALGGPTEHERLAAQLDRPSHRAPALFALAFSGNVEQVPRLLAYLDAKEAIVAKRAAQAVSTIVGLDLLDNAFVRRASAPPGETEDAERSLPPLEEDDLDADLVPAPEDALPTPDAAAIREHCRALSARFDRGRRYLGGQPSSLDTMVEYLERAPLRRRHVIALSLEIRAQGAARVDTRALADRQRGRLASIRRIDAREVARGFGRW